MMSGHMIVCLYGIVIMQDHKSEFHPSYVVKVIHHDYSCTLLYTPTPN